MRPRCSSLSASSARLAPGELTLPVVSSIAEASESATPRGPFWAAAKPTHVTSVIITTQRRNAGSRPHIARSPEARASKARVGALPTVLTRDPLAPFHRRLLRESLRTRMETFARCPRFQCISGGIAINHRANRERLPKARGATRRFRPTKCQGHRVRWNKGIEPADLDDASDPSIAAMRAAHGAAHGADLGADLGAGLASRPGARAGAGTIQ